MFPYKYVLILWMMLLSAVVHAQFSNDLIQGEKKLKIWFDSLFLKNDVVYMQTDEKKCAYSDSISTTFMQMLKEKDAFNYPFDSLTKISKLTSTDSLVRIFTWNIRLKGGIYRYYGLLLYRRNIAQTTASVFKLKDVSDSIPDSTAETSTLINSNWYGALYYQLYNYVNKGKNYYLLIGWKGYSNYVTKKVIDILYFNRLEKPVFGKTVFKSEQATVKRKIFNFSLKATMVCKYDSSHHAVIFDHLVPISKNYKGMHEFYGPNGTFDGYFYSNGSWYFREDIEPKNPPIKSNIPSKK